MKRILLFILFIFLVFAVNSSSIKNLSIEQGLSNRRVFGSACDKKGYIWFSTKTNIDRYDGEQFDAYKLSNNEKNRGITTDRNKNIYAFTERSAYIYDERIDDFRKVFSLNDRKDFFADAAISYLFFDNENNFYIATNQGVLYQDRDKWIPIDALIGKMVNCIINTPSGLYLFGTSNGIVQFRKTEKNELKTDQNPFFSIFANMRIQSLYFDEKTDKLWIGSFANGLYLYDVIRPKTPAIIHKTTLPIKIITDISGNEIWAGSDGEGIFVFDRFGFQFRKLISQAENQEENIGANGIYHILQANGSVWISTYTGGVYVVNTQSIVDKQFYHQKFNRNSINDDHVNVIFEDSEGDLWFGTNKGLSMYQRKTNSWKQYLLETPGAYSENSVILSVFEDNSGSIWVGGYATKLVKINKRTGGVSEVKNFKSYNESGKSYIYSIIQDESGNIWLGGSVDMLRKYDPQTGLFTSYEIDGINKLLNFNTEKMYLATSKGLYLLNKSTGKLQVVDFNKLEGGEKLVSFPFINNIIRDRFDENVLWLGTEGFGLYRYNLKNAKLEVINTKSGLTSDYIYGLLYDNSDRLWISTENGLDCYNPKTMSVVSYFEFDGLTNNSFNFLAYARLRNGKLMFGTPQGANEISPDNIQKKETPEFNLRFKGFYLFYEKMKAQTDESPLNESIDETKEIDLTYTQHTFSIDFINLNIANRGRTFYSWKLDGFDDDWTQPTTEHKAIYTNIPAGNYKFMVKAISIDTHQESEIRVIEIHKHPPFWASIYAYLIYTALLIWLVYFLIKFWLNKVDSKFTQEKIKFFVSMAHEIRTPITLIKAPLNEIDNENLTKEGRSALELARKNTDKLFGMVSQLLDFQKIEADAMNLCIEETHLNVFIDNILNNFTYLAKSKGIDFNKTKEIPGDITVWIDRNKVQIMLENLLTNAIKYTEKGGYINLLVELNSYKLMLQVSDNGIGIPSKAHAKLFESFYRASNASHSVEVGTGIGLMFTKKLVDLHKGTISFVSSENVGSTFRIEIPIERSAYQEDDIIQHKIETEETEVVEDDENQMHIMLVEDNDDLRTYLAKMLKKKYSVIEAANGLEAIQLLEKESPDLILSDILMPEMNGFELCENVKSNISTCHIPFILLSSLSDREDVIKGISLGADDYITKPFDIIILESKIRTIFNNRALFRKKYIEKSVSLNESHLLNDLNKTFMKKLVDLVEANITNEEFNIDELSYEMAMSRSVFFKKVKSLTGQNPKDFIRDIKMNKAADLLRDQKYSVSEIAYLIGFPNAKYFSTAFKKYYGISPTSFIEKEKRDESYLENNSEEDI